MFNVSFNGTDMSGKTTLMYSVKKSFDKKNLKIGISPHLMKFADMSLKDRLDMYEVWSPDAFTKQALREVCARLDYTRQEFSGYDFVFNDRGVLTQLGFCMGKYMTDKGLNLEESFEVIEKESRRIPLEDMSIILDVPMEIAFIRAEGKEVWGEHYQNLITDTRESIKYLYTQDYIQNIFNLGSVESLNKLRNKSINKILGFKKQKDVRSK